MRDKKTLSDQLEQASLMVTNLRVKLIRDKQEKYDKDLHEICLIISKSIDALNYTGTANVEKKDRNLEILRLREDEGRTLSSIAEKFNLSKTRVKKIVDHYGSKKKFNHV